MEDQKTTEGQPQVGSDELFALRAELRRYREREKLCQTMDQAEKLALIRALQEIRDEVGLLGDGVSPRQIVDAVRRMKANNESALDVFVGAINKLRGDDWEKILAATAPRILEMEFDGEDTDSNRVLCKVLVTNAIFDIRDFYNAQATLKAPIDPP